MSKIAIVGGGVAGLSAAAMLAQDGHEVLVFEAEAQLGYHASGRSAAMFEENYGNDTVRVLNKATGPVLSDMGVLSPRGVLLVAKAAEAKQFHQDAEELGMTQVTLGAARELVPILSANVAHAALHEEAMDIDTNAVLQGFASQARRNGAKLETDARVACISGSFKLHVAGAEVEADIVVNASGAWADVTAISAGASGVGLQPFRRSMARLPAPGGHDVRYWPMLFGAGETWYAKPDAGGWIVSPAEEDPVDPMDAWAEDMVLAEGLARYETYVTEPVARLETSWAGLRTFASDRTLVIGEEPTCPNFFWCAGQGGYGFQTSAGASAHLAAMIGGRQSPFGDAVTEALSPKRFRKN